jgi:hypothetical protein
MLSGLAVAKSVNWTPYPYTPGGAGYRGIANFRGLYIFDHTVSGSFRPFHFFRHFGPQSLARLV